MFPNPQDALALPERPNLEHYRKLAKELVKACKAGVIHAWIKPGFEDFARRKLSEKCALTSAQFVIARSYGFESWQTFAGHLEEIARRNSPVSMFEAAADAIVMGDAATLERLLRENPELIQAVSSREHGARLLHYVAANGVENYRQKTPPNIVEIAGILLHAGAEVDAEANVYGGGCTALGLAATSVHPRRAGVQEALLQVLLDHGARLDLQSAGNRHSLVTACLANGQPGSAEFLALRGAPLDLTAAAGVGRLDAVTKFLAGGVLKEQLNRGFLYACAYGRNEVVASLLKEGVDLAWHQPDGQTALHMAVIGGQLETVKRLLPYHPPLEAVNAYGGTVWGQTLWSAAHGGDADRYIAILEELAAAGAKIGAKHVPVNDKIDRWLAARGSVAEPGWHWFGEKPAADPSTLVS